MSQRRAVSGLVCLGLLACAGGVQAATVTLLHDSNPQANYSARKLGEALSERGYTLRREKTGYDLLVNLVVHQHLPAESFAIIPEGKVITVEGGDARGLIYGALQLAENLRNGIPLEKTVASEQRPHLAFRGIKFNTPWDTYRPSSALDQHVATARDLKFWEAFFDMMVANRFNAISLWTLHPFTYMVQPKNFPEASPWTQKEFAQWQHLYREIFRMAKEHGLDTYQVFWSIFVSEQFAKAHGVAQQNFYPHYYVPGDTSQIVRRYLRESVTQMLEEYPDLDGIGVSHGEGMAGMTPSQRQQWIDDVLIAGALAAKRPQPVKLIHRVPFSSGLSSEPGVSSSVEEVTRDAMEKLGDSFAGPIWVEMKFNWSHGHSTPKLVKVHGGTLGDTYFKPRPDNYKIVWQVRNEDFFALRWGVPDFIRQHIALNGGAEYVGGYFVGSETYIPALDYFTAPKKPVDWKWAFERQWLFYKLWGRLLYDPKTPDSEFSAEYLRRYGPKAQNLLSALSLASNTQMRLASLYDSKWDFTLYGEGFLALQGEKTSYIGVDALINQPTLDPAYVSVSNYVKTLAAGGSFGADRVTPPALIDSLERDNKQALRLVKDIDASGNASLTQEVADVRIWANLGLHLASKLRGALALESFRQTGGEEKKKLSIEQLGQALAFWDEIVSISRPIYKDMPLTHYNHNSFAANPDNLFHWAHVRAEVARDVEVAKAAVTK